jgi:hypothetical protein
VGQLLFFSARQGATVEAIAERLFPANELGPGAAAIGVLTYIDRALAGHDAALQETYVRGLAALDAAAEVAHGGAFAALPAEQQDGLLGEMERGMLPGMTAPSGLEFFEVLLTHTRQGLFGDPVHGGNRDGMGWQLLGYPGVRDGFSREEQLG